MLRRRPAPVVSHMRAALFGLVLALAVTPLVVPLLSAGQSLKEGDRAPRTLEAARDAQYESDALTAQKRADAARRVAEVPLPVDPAIRQQQTDRVDRLLESVRTIRLRTDLTDQQRLTEIGNLPTAEKLAPAGRSALLALDRATFDQLHSRAARALADILQKPTPQADIRQRITEYLDANPPASTTPLELTAQTALRELLNAFVVPNFQVDAAATQKKRDEARANESPVIVTYTRGQVIVSEGQLIHAPDIEALKQTGVLGDGFDYYRAAAGGLLALGFGALVAAYVIAFQPFPSPPTRRMLLVGVTTVAALVAVRVALPEFTPDRDQRYFAFALPVPIAAMVAASFAELHFAAIIAVATAFIAAFSAAAYPDLAGASFSGSLESLELAMAYGAGGLAGAVVVHRASHLSRFGFAAFAVAGATGLVLVVFWLIGEPRPNASLAWLALAAGINGLGSALVTVGIFVLLSIAFGVTTRLHLMELTESGHVLLRRLQDEAPGTYHHSMMVGALAERAADRIGADALVARVGAYYHGVGKLAKPRFYVENMLDGAVSPHDALPPAESAAIIREHVSNGVEIARRYRVPSVIRDFIPQHHGTRLVSYFYRRALQAEQSVDPAAFRYGGPRPQTKETAIVMLADSCEAVVRARQEQRPPIDELVDGVFAERLSEGQFDECDITMRDLQEVAASFKATLRAVYHPRIEYPTPGPEELANVARG